MLVKRVLVRPVRSAWFIVRMGPGIRIGLGRAFLEIATGASGLYLARPEPPTPAHPEPPAECLSCMYATYPHGEIYCDPPMGCCPREYSRLEDD